MNIFLIEDDTGLVNLITQNLEELGFSVMSTNSGTEAIEYLKNQNPDLILLDYSLPDINGKELIERLIKQQTPPPPFIITTGQGDERIAVNMMKLGAKDYLIKDTLFLEKLPDVVNRVIKEIQIDSKLKQAEEALIESEKRFKALHNASFGGIAIHDMGIIKDCNQGLSNITGYTFEELIGMDGLLCIAEDSRKAVMQNIKASYEKAYEVVGLRKNGEEFPVRLEAKMIPYEGKTMRVVEFRDITERKHAEEEKHAAEENLKNTFDISPSIISKANIDSGFFVEVNQAVTRILGYSVEEFTSKPIMDFIHPDDRQRTTDEISEQLEGKEVTFFENRYLCKNGSYKWMAWHSTKADDNGIVTAIGSDINERKKAEFSVRRLSSAVKQSPSVIAITDIHGIIEYVNPKFTELTGYSSSEAVGQMSNILKSGDQDSTFYKDLWDTIESRKVWKGQFHNKKKNGELFWEASSISAILNDSGDVINYLKIGEDITQQKETEIKLKAALEKARESDRLKSAFLSNMSHEIRTPMNGILGFVNLLNQPNLSKSDISEYSAIINKSGQRLLDTINDIIDISKIEAGELIVSNTETHINNELEELHSFFLPEANKKGLSLNLAPTLSNGELTIITDNNKLHGILTNLIKNAIKFTDEGTITFGYLIKKEFIEFFVEDSGIGIPKDRMQAVFNRFEQADIGDKRAFEGSGLGLAISEAYIKVMGGQIFVESVKGKGSKFSFTIPYIKEIKKEIEQFPRIKDTSIRRVKDLRVLIAEDDYISSELIKSMLKGIFKELIVVDNGKDAIKICKDRPELDLVLMDIKMPEMNGYETTRQIRKFNNKLIIIAQTAYALSGDKNKAIEAGCNDYITKPIDKKKLLEIINKLLDSKQSN